MLNRDIFNQSKRNRERVVPCFIDDFGDFLVLALNVNQRNEFDSKLAQVKYVQGTPEHSVELAKLLLFHCLCDESGSKILREEDLEDFEELPGVYNNIAQECMRINYMLKSQVDDVKKKPSPQKES